jgi:hypothetical protein
MARFIRDRAIEPVARLFTTLDELRVLALANGCTPAQFNHAVETIGAHRDPVTIAQYLKQRSFLPASFRLQAEA